MLKNWRKLHWHHLVMVIVFGLCMWLGFSVFQMGFGGIVSDQDKFKALAEFGMSIVALSGAFLLFYLDKFLESGN